MTERIDWPARAVESEASYSVARGGTATQHDRFVHIHNEHVPWSGDYNRVVGLRVGGADEFEQVVPAVEAIHRGLGLNRPDSYDTYPSSDGDAAWLGELDPGRFRAWGEVFFKLRARESQLPKRVVWQRVGEGEYLKWKIECMREQGWFEQQEWEVMEPLERLFIRTFRPFWLLEDGERVASTHCANLGGYFRLFDVTVEEPLRGRGYGRLLMEVVSSQASSEGAQHVLIRCLERLGGFYEKCGFEECARGSVIRLRKELR